jgi:hypothetical protein
MCNLNVVGAAFFCSKVKSSYAGTEHRRTRAGYHSENNFVAPFIIIIERGIDFILKA